MANAKYIIFVEDQMQCAPVKDADFKYFLKILPHLRPLSDRQYCSGVAVFLQSLARFSYVLYKKDLYWCVEWDPGLIVVRFSADATMAATALRSPIPNFGGREPDQVDEDGYDEDSENHQYNLVFRAWDAQFDEQWRQWSSYGPADKKTANQFEAALEHVQSLGARLEKKYKDRDAVDEWLEKCEDNLKKWAGEGIRIRD